MNGMQLHLYVPTYASIYLGMLSSRMQNFIYDKLIARQNFSKCA